MIRGGKQLIPYEIWRHDAKEPIKKLIKVPKLAETRADPKSNPLTDFSLWNVDKENSFKWHFESNCLLLPNFRYIYRSWRYLKKTFCIFQFLSFNFKNENQFWTNKVPGATFNPKKKFNKKNSKQICQNESAIPSAINAKAIGSMINIIARRRPSPSDRKPLRALPNGYPIKFIVAARHKHSQNQMESQWFELNKNDQSHLHSHEASLPLIRIVSFVVEMPCNAGIINDVSPSNNEPLITMRFLINVTSTCGKTLRNVLISSLAPNILLAYLWVVHVFSLLCRFNQSHSEKNTVLSCNRKKSVFFYRSTTGNEQISMSAVIDIDSQTLIRKRILNFYKMKWIVLAIQIDPNG